jgi:hypothetical protein
MPHLLHGASIAVSVGTVTTPVREEDPPPPPEELVLGPRRRRELPRWVSLVALAVGLLIIAGGALWRFWPRPIEPLSLADVQNTYAGMVRADGTNDASVMTRQTVTESPVAVKPEACAPLVEATVANRFPAAAQDGVGTYWVGRSSTISLFTLRFDQTEQALAERARIAAALDGCADQEIFVRRTEPGSVQAWRATVTRTPAGPADQDQLGYTLTGTDGLAGPDGLMAIQLMPYLNTITWQYRYESGSGSYSTLAADQLLESMRTQLDAVVAARPT